MQSFLSKPHTLYFHEKNAAYGPVKLTYSALFLSLQFSCSTQLPITIRVVIIKSNWNGDFNKDVSYRWQHQAEGKDKTQDL